MKNIFCRTFANNYFNVLSKPLSIFKEFQACVNLVTFISGDVDNIPDPKVKKLVHAQLN